MDQDPNQPVNEVPPTVAPQTNAMPTPPPAPVAPRPVLKDVQKTADPNGPNQLAALMLGTTLGPFGYQQLVLGNKTQGWVRFSLGVLSIPLSLILIGYLILFVLGIWAAVDFVRIGFGLATDSAGNKLAGSVRDGVWSKVITIVSIVLWSLYILLLITIVAFGTLNFMNGTSSTGSSADTVWPESRSY